MPTYQALYYPYIHFRSDAWLKTAALYWDKMARIVPQRYTTEDSDTVRALGKFVVSLRPNQVHPEFANAFRDFIEQFGPKLKAKYSLSRRRYWPELTDADRPPKPGGASGNDPRLGYIFVEKISAEVYAALQKWQLASTDDRGSQWIGMHPRLAWVYMTALAEQMAGERGLRPLTAEPRDHVAVSGLSMERLAHALLGNVSLVGAGQTPNEAETMLVSIAFRAVVPKGIGTLPVDKVLAFREEHAVGRRRFQDAVAGLLKGCEWTVSISDPKVLEERLRDEYDKVWAVQLTELEQKLHDVGIDTAWACFNVKTTLPAIVAGGAAALTSPVQPIAAASAALALGAIPVLRDKRKAARKALDDAPVSYLYQMDQTLTPKGVWRKVKQKARSFVLDV